MGRVVLMVGLAAVISGCAPVAPPKMSWAEAYGIKEGETVPVLPPDVKQPREAPDTWALKFNRPGECEKAASVLAAGLNRSVGWSYLKGCLHRPDFGHLQLLLKHWGNELRTKPESLELIAQVLANRGGTVDQDLPVLQKAKLSLFGLGAVSTQPRRLTGRPMVFLGRVEDVASVKGHDELTVLEVSRKESDSASYSSGYTRRNTGMLADTGVQVTVKLRQPDPFLIQGQTFLFLARFEQLAKVDAQSDDEAPQKLPTLSLLFYSVIGSQGTVED